MPRCCVLVPCGASCHRCIEIQSASFRADKQRRKPNEVLIQMRNTANDQFRRFGASWVLGFALILGVWGGAAGCKSAPPFGNAEVDKSVGDVKLRPGLVIGMSVLVAGKKEIEEPSKRISEGGTLILPLLGETSVTDLTLEELQSQLAKSYRKYFVDPQVTLDFSSDAEDDGISPWGYVTVLGRVKRPGRVDIPPTRDLTVSLAIQQAGGFDTSAKETAIAVTRRTAGGQSQTRQINLREIGARGQVDKDIMLLPDDVVYVPELIF